MTIDLNKFLKAKRFSQEFNLDDPLDQVIPKTTAGSAVGDAIAAAVGAIPVIPDATSTVKGKVSLAVGAEIGSTSDVEAATPAFVAASIAAIDPADYASTDAGNALGLGTDGKLKVVLPAQLPDDQVFSGDNAGTVGLTMTPVVDPVSGNTNYTVKADLKVAPTAPAAGFNLLESGASGFFVDPQRVANKIANNAVALASIVGALPSATDTIKGIIKTDNTTSSTATDTAATPALVNAKVAAAVASIVLPAAATSAETITGTDNAKFVTPKDLKDTLSNSALYPISVKGTSTAPAVSAITTGTSTQWALTATNNSSANGGAAYIGREAGPGEALSVNSTAASIGNAISVTKSGSGSGDGIVISKSGSGYGTGMYISYAGTSYGQGLEVIREPGATGPGGAAAFNNKASNAEPTVQVRNDGTGDTIYAGKTGSNKAGKAAAFEYNNTPASGSPAVTISHTSASGGGGTALEVTKSGATQGQAIYSNRSGSAQGAGLVAVSSTTANDSDGVYAERNGAGGGHAVTGFRTGSGVGAAGNFVNSSTAGGDYHAVYAQRDSAIPGSAVYAVRNVGSEQWGGILGQYDGIAGKSGVYGFAGTGVGAWAGYFSGNAGVTGWLKMGTDNEYVGQGNTNTGLNVEPAGDGRALFLSRGTFTPLHINLNSNGGAAAFRRSGVLVGNIDVTTTTTSYNSVSDYRLKTVDGPVTNSGAFIDALKPVTGEWKAEPGKKAAFFLAHEVQEVSPSSVKGVKDAVDEDGNAVMQSMEYGSAEFIVNIIAELQALRKRVAELESK